MDIENLNRTQIILLTLLVSFVTSIATGIVTVSLVQQAPPGVTQTINRVVERTVEKVTPSQAASVITKETTVVVKEDDLITKSIQKDSQSVVSLYRKVPGPDGTTASQFLGWGVMLTGDGIFATDSGIITDSSLYSIKTADGKNFEARVLTQDEDLGVALLQGIGGDVKHPFTAATLGDPDKLSLGQGLIIFGGSEKSAITTGIVSSLTSMSGKQEGTSTPIEFVGYIDTNLPPVGAVRGGPLATIFGEIVGISVGDKGTRFISENILSQKLALLSKATTTPAQ